MAQVRLPVSGTHSANGGKFYITVDAVYTTSATTITAKVHITDALNSKQKFVVQVSGKKKNKIEKKKKGTYTIGTWTIKDLQKIPKITIDAAGWGKSIAANTFINKVATPSPPSAVKAVKVNDAQINITVSGTGKALSPTNKIYIQRAKDTTNPSDWQDLNSSGWSVSQASDKTFKLSVSDTSSDIERGHRYFYRARTYNTTSDKYSAYTKASTFPVYTTSNNEALTGSLVAERLSNAKIRVSWEISSVAYINNKLVKEFEIHVSENGGAYVQKDTVPADISKVSYSYDFEKCSANKTYRFKLKIKGTGSVAETYSDESDIVYMQPTMPSGVEASRDSSDDVIITVTGKSYSATHVSLEKSLNSGAFFALEEKDYADEVVFTDDDVEITDDVIYRARYRCAELSGDDQYSEYKSSSVVAVKSKPDPPTLNSPVSGARIALSEGSVKLIFQHNATDGSGQEAADVKYKINDGAWAEETLETESFYELDISACSAGDVVTWQVRTKGAFDEYSNWNESEFTILTEPSLIFTAPDNGEVISELPITLEWEYNDESGTLQELTFSITKDHQLIDTFEVDVGTGESGTYSYSLAGFLFDNDSVYGITATALSSTNLQAISDISISIQYEDVSLEGGLIPIVEFDDDGIASILIDRDMTPPEGSEDEPDPVEMSKVFLYRVHDGETVLVAEDIDEGSLIEDKYAPINVSFEYKLLMFTADSEVSIVTVEVEQDSNYSYIYWGDDGIARAEFNMEGSSSFSRPEKKQIRYSGRRYPVTYDSSAIEETISFSATVLDREELDSFRQMMRDGGSGIWKSSDGDSYDADFEFDYSTKYYEETRVWECSLDVTRVEGDH